MIALANLGPEALAEWLAGGLRLPATLEEADA